MSSNQQLDALAAARAHNATLFKVIVLVAVLGGMGMFFAYRMPKQLDVHMAPNIKAGDTITAINGKAEVPIENVYGFAYYIWQQINRWQNDGGKDYGEQIFRFQSYITPTCRAQLQADMQARFDAGELRMRTRHMTEIPGFGFASNRVIQEGSGAWTVLMDMQLQESFRGQPVKDTFIRYPVRIVSYDVDRERNPWRLAIDCYGNHRPQRLDMTDVRAVTTGKARPDLPGTVTPSALPRTTGEAIDPNAAPQVVPVQQTPPPSAPASTPSVKAAP